MKKVIIPAYSSKPPSLYVYVTFSCYQLPGASHISLSRLKDRNALISSVNSAILLALPAEDVGLIHAFISVSSTSIPLASIWKQLYPLVRRWLLYLVQLATSNDAEHCLHNHSSYLRSIRNRNLFLK